MLADQKHMAQRRPCASPASAASITQPRISAESTSSTPAATETPCEDESCSIFEQGHTCAEAIAGKVDELTSDSASDRRGEV